MNTKSDVAFSISLKRSSAWCTQLIAPEMVQSWMDQPYYACFVLDQDGLIQSCNVTFLNYLGKKPDEVFGQKLNSLFSPSAFHTLTQNLARVFSGESVLQQDLAAGAFLREVCFNQYPLYHRNNSEVAGMLCCLEMKPEKPLPSNQISAQILNSLNIYYVLVDAKMRIQAFNPKLLDLPDSPFKLEKGRPILTSCPKYLHEKYVSPYFEALKGEIISQELKINDNWWAIHHRPVLDEGKIVSVLITATNIDDWAKMRQEFKILTQELMNSNAELQQFAYITSHNLRAPVVNIVSLIEFIDRQQLGSGLNQQIFDKMEVSAVRLENTLQDLVRVVAIKDRKNVFFQRVRFRELLDELLETIEWDMIESEAMIQVDFSKAREILYPRNYLMSICQNLLTNSMKYRQERVRPRILLSSFVEKGYVGIQVKDNGRGIDLGTYGDRLFGLYQRFHEGEGLPGKGLGLYIVKSQVDSLEGRIEVQSVVGEGSTFRVYLRPIRGL